MISDTFWASCPNNVELVYFLRHSHLPKFMIWLSWVCATQFKWRWMWVELCLLNWRTFIVFFPIEWTRLLDCLTYWRRDVKIINALYFLTHAHQLCITASFLRNCYHSIIYWAWLGRWHKRRGKKLSAHSRVQVRYSSLQLMCWLEDWISMMCHWLFNLIHHKIQVFSFIVQVELLVKVVMVRQSSCSNIMREDSYNIWLVSKSRSTNLR